MPSTPPSSFQPDEGDNGSSGDGSSGARAVEEAEQRFRALFDTAPVPICITRVSVLLYANPAFVALVGARDAQELAGYSVHDFLDSTRREEMMADSRARVTQGFGSQPTQYEIAVIRFDGTRIPIRTQIAPISWPGGDAVISFAFDLSNERDAQSEIRTLLEREQRAVHLARQMQNLSQALSRANSPEEVAAVGLEVCLDATGAFGGLFVVPREEDGETRLHLSQARGYSEEAVAGWETMSIHDPTPVAHAFRCERAVWVGDVEDQNLRAQFPVLELARQSGTGALVAIPLRLEARVLGVLGLTFGEERPFDEEERTFMETLAASCAQSLERARLDAQGQDLTRRQHESLALLNTLLDSAPVGFGLFDRDHRFVLVNEELARINSLTVEDHIGARPSDLLPGLGERVEALLEGVWKSGLPSGQEEFTQGQPEDGAGFRHCSMALYPVRVGGADGGDILGVGAILIEQTERVRGEIERERLFGQLETERARFEAILQQMPSGVTIAEAPSGRLILGNEQVAEIWGHEYRNADSVAEYAPMYRGYHLDGRPMESTDWPLARALQKGEIVRGEEVLIERGGGDMGVMRLNAAPIRGADGQITAAVAVFDNVTARARADAGQRFLAEAGSVLVAALGEDEIFESIARLCVPQVADWCILAVPDAEGKLQQIALAHTGETQTPLAEKLRELLSRNPDLPWDVTGAMKSGRSVLYPAQQLQPMEPKSDYGRMVKEMGVQSAIIAPLSARGRVVGVMFWLSTDAKRPFDQSTLELAEELARRVGLSADNLRLLQEAQTARDAAQRARDEAQMANLAKDEFLAVVSHELRTPLTPILGWLELLRSADSDQSLRAQAYDVIERNALAQAQLVNDILDMSRITTGKLRLELHNLRLDELVARSVESLRPFAGDKKLSLHTNIEPSLWVRGDAGRLGQVVWNLLQNAAKFTPPDGTIEVTLSRAQTGSQVRLQVRDSGAGIEPDLLPHIFERFRQGDSSSTRKVGGLGLGLAIVKHIVDLHGGQAGAQSEGRGQGATFWVEVPRLEAAALPEMAPANRAIRSLEGRLKGAKILVVDDEPDTREMLARLLEEAGASVRLASNGRAALDIAGQFAPDALVSDIGMPEMDGLELRREMKARGFSVPAVALTAYASGQDEARARAAGFERYLPKPVGARQLVDCVMELLAL